MHIFVAAACLSRVGFCHTKGLNLQILGLD